MRLFVTILSVWDVDNHTHCRLKCPSGEEDRPWGLAMDETGTSFLRIMHHSSRTKMELLRTLISKAISPPLPPYLWSLHIARSVCVRRQHPALGLCVAAQPDELKRYSQ